MLRNHHRCYLLFTKSQLRKQWTKSTIGCCGFFRLFGCVLKVVLPNVSPVSVAGIFGGQESERRTEHRQHSDSCPLKMPATEAGETLGRTTFRTRPKSKKNPQQPSDPSHESLRENYLFLYRCNGYQHTLLLVDLQSPHTSKSSPGGERMTDRG